MTDFKRFPYTYPWTNKASWLMPADELMMQGQFPIVDEAMERTLKYIPEDRRRVCVQAGGAFGLWPMAYSRFFETVHTFEPHRDNFVCLSENLQDTDNIIYYHGALWDNLNDKLAVSYAKKVMNSYGAHFVAPTNAAAHVSLWTIDSLGFDIDHIQLDVEGNELRALKGAEQVIDRCSPVITIEERGLIHSRQIGHRVGDASSWLQKKGYRVMERFHNDVVLAR